MSIKEDCDGDTFLVLANPQGPTCHKGTDTCWAEKNETSFGFLSQLENIIAERKESRDTSNSYISFLFNSGINKIAQKVGEEAVEVVIEAKDNDPELFLNESADMLFHFLILLQAKEHSLKEVVEVLSGRNRK